MFKASRKALLKMSSILLLAALTLVGCGGSKSTGSYSQIVVFGASLSDNGNAVSIVPGLFPGAPYYPGRASNGLLWIDLVAEELGNSVNPFVNGGTNYAVGGARTCAISGTSINPFDMCYQATLYLTGALNKADADALYVVDATSVGNNIFAVINNGLPGSVVTTEAPADIVKIIVNLVACATPDTYTYWDNLHPTTATGRNMAKTALAVL